MRRARGAGIGARRLALGLGLVVLAAAGTGRAAGRPAPRIGVAAPAARGRAPEPATPSRHVGAGAGKPADPARSDVRTGTGAARQNLALDAVRIEGKLYSPQALFIVSRTPERFGRDAVVPHYLQPGDPAGSLPYRLRPELLQAAVQAAQQPAGPGSKSER